MRSALLGLGLLVAGGCGNDRAVPVDGWLSLDDAGQLVPIDAFEKPAFPVTCSAGITMPPMPDKFGGAITANEAVSIAYQYDPTTPGMNGVYSLVPDALAVAIDRWTFTPKPMTRCTLRVTNAATDAFTITCLMVQADEPIASETDFDLELTWQDSKGMMLASAMLPTGALQGPTFTNVSVKGAGWQLAGPIFACE